MSNKSENLTAPNQSQGRIERRFLSGIFFLYAALVFYGSIMPFDFSINSDLILANFQRVWTFWPLSNVSHTSTIDLISNFALYLPLGLLAALRWKVGYGEIDAVTYLNAFAWGAAVSLAVEITQLMSPLRVSGVQDFTMNVLGTMAGATFGTFFVDHLYQRLKTVIMQWWTDQPVRLVAATLMLLLAGDALFPFVPTLDVSMVLNNVKGGIWNVSEGLAQHPTSYWVIREGSIYALLTILLGYAMGKRNTPNWTSAVIVSIAFAAALELGKSCVAYMGHSVNVANPLIAAIGSIAGVGIGYMTRDSISEKNAICFGIFAMVVYLGYLSWGDMNFNTAAATQDGNLPSGAEWLPLYHYGMSGRGEKVLLFIRTIVLSGALGYMLRVLGRLNRRHIGILRIAVTTGILGVILEGGQYWIPGRHPTTTDVFCFILGGVLGSILAGLTVTKNSGEVAQP
ncbi:MAG: VanZ family protein [Phycisphaerae bacterium]|nr:VanZ family protein [Phycisphaerae bacterium]